MKPANDIVLIKWGGSLITDKTGEASARHEVIDRLAAEMSQARQHGTQPWLLGHGSGSFGHVAAMKHGMKNGLRDGDPLGAAITQDMAARLHRIVAASLLNAGLPAFSWAPSCGLQASAGQPGQPAAGPMVAALDRGFLPVVYGDVLMDDDWGASICSTEGVLAQLIADLRQRGRRVARLLWLGKTAGIYDREGRTIPRVEPSNLEQVQSLIGSTEGVDVTGGMRLRLDTAVGMARQGIESHIVDGTVPGLLATALRGESVPGTWVGGFG